MSYTKRFSRTISVRYSGNFSYPASQHGGTKYFSGTAEETVHFDVTVNTDPFDDSVTGMKEGVDLLTGAVAASEAAQVESIIRHSNDIGRTIIAGFFKTAKSDISQQITELKARAEALLIQLNRLAGRCRDKKRQMGADYERIASRYARIFTDLDNELANRIHAIDEPVFSFRHTVDARGEGAETMVAAPAVTAGENAKAVATMAASVAKRRAIETIGKMQRFIQTQHDSDTALGRCLMEGGESGTLCTPVAVALVVDGHGVTRAEVYTSPLLDGAERQPLAESGAMWPQTTGPVARQRITGYFNLEMADSLRADSTARAERVARTAASLFNNHFTHER